MVEVDLEKGTRAKECRINILPNQLTCVVRDKTLFNVSQQSKRSSYVEMII